MILTAYRTRPTFGGNIEQKDLLLKDTTEYYLYSGEQCVGEIRIGKGIHVIIYEEPLLRIAKEEFLI